MPKDFSKHCDRESNALASRARGPDFKFRPFILGGFYGFPEADFWICCRV